MHSGKRKQGKTWQLEGEAKLLGDVLSFKKEKT